MKWLILIICAFSFNGNRTDTAMLYWEQLTKKQQKAMLDSPDLNKDILQFYYQKIEASDNERTFLLLDTLTSKEINENELSLKFHLFNRICKSSDGALSEMIGMYCRNMILNHAEYVLHYLEQNNEFHLMYSNFLGYEFVLNEDIYVDSTELHFDYFKNRITLDKATVPNKFINKFCDDIQLRMNFLIEKNNSGGKLIKISD